MTDLSPTEALIADILAARHRLGEPFWPIERRNRKALDSLGDKGFVSYQSGWGPHDYRAQLTDAGRAEFMKADYVAPALDPNCRSFYFGPKTGEMRVDCTRTRHGEDKEHRADWVKKKKGRVVKGTVKWTDDEAFGYASETYGDRLREADQQTRP